MAPTHFFLIDVSYTAVSSGATASACASVARVLDELPGAPLLSAPNPCRRCRRTTDSRHQFVSVFEELEAELPLSAAWRQRMAPQAPHAPDSALAGLKKDG